MTRKLWIAALLPACLGLACAATFAGDSSTQNTHRPRKEHTQKNAEQKVAAREQRQQERINSGIKKGQLTDEEIQTLQTQHDNLTAMTKNYESDGKLTKDEARQLETALNTASENIWAQKHDTQGNQKPAYFLGKNVFAKDSTTATLQDPNLTKAQAKKFTSDFRSLLQMKKQLATQDLSADDRTKLQSQYNDLLNQYFIIKNPSPTTNQS